MAMKTDCYFCDEYRDMGASTDICNYPSKLEDKFYANCENCRRYISKKAADMLVKMYIDEAICKEDHPELFDKNLTVKTKGCD